MKTYQINVTVTFVGGTAPSQVEDVRQGIEDLLMPKADQGRGFSHPVIDDVLMEVLEDDSTCSCCGKEVCTGIIRDL